MFRQVFFDVLTPNKNPLNVTFWFVSVVSYMPDRTVKKLDKDVPSYNIKMKLFFFPVLVF